MKAKWWQKFIQWGLVAGIIIVPVCLLLLVLPASAAQNDTTITANIELVTDVSATNITQTSATISWATNDDATSQVSYDTVAHADIADYADNITDNATVTVHSISLTGLSAGTTYHYRVRSLVNGADFVSDDYTFTTLSPPLYMTDVSATNITQTSATISWKTSDNATSQVSYDTVAHANIADYADNITDSANVTVHSISLTGLDSSTTYHYRVRSLANGDEFVSDDYTFTTLTPQVSSALPAVPSITDTKGIVKQTTTKASSDGICGLSIPRGTKALTKAGKPLSKVTVAKMAEPPAPPTGSNIIGLTYDLGPDGATFDPPITLTLTYDPDEIPAEFDEDDLVIAMWDEDAGEWVELAGCIIDPVTHTITAPVSHFTAFTILTVLTVVTPPIDEEYEAALAALAEAEAAKAPAKADLAAAQAQVTSLQEDVDTAEAQVESLQDDIDTVEAKVTSLQSDLDAAQARLAAAQDEVTRLEAELGPNWGVIGGIIAGVVVIVGLLVYFLAVRRRAY